MKSTNLLRTVALVAVVAGASPAANAQENGRGTAVTNSPVTNAAPCTPVWACNTGTYFRTLATMSVTSTVTYLTCVCGSEDLQASEPWGSGNGSIDGGVTECNQVANKLNAGTHGIIPPCSNINAYAPTTDGLQFPPAAGADGAAAGGAVGAGR